MPNLAPQRFVEWMSANKHIDRIHGHEYRYHSRSDSHSKSLCLFVAQDVAAACLVMAEQASQGKIAYSVNLKYEWPKSGKAKAIDLAIGIASGGVLQFSDDEKIAAGDISKVILSCEAKTCMTEHGKSQPRIFDELASSHSIVHNGDMNAIAAGITVVNIADRFVSPLRESKGEPLHWTEHKQPHATERMVNHLRGLPIRENATDHGFDAYATIVINCDNQGPATLCTQSPAPQAGDKDHYDTFVQNIARAWAERFSNI